MAERLLEAIEECISGDARCYATFMEILEDNLPDEHRELLEDMKRELEERSRFGGGIQCGDDRADNRLAQPCTDVENSGAMVTSVNGSRHVFRVSDGKMRNGVGNNTREEESVRRPVQAESDDTEGKLVYHTSSSTSSARQEDNTEKNLLKKDLQRAIVVRIKLEKQLQDKINRVNKLKKQKDQKEKDLKRQLEHLEERLSECESQRHRIHSSYERCKNRLSKVVSDYDSQIAAHENEIEDLKERLTQQEDAVKEKEQIISELEEELQKERRRSSNVQKEVDKLRNRHFQKELEEFIIFPVILAVINIIAYVFFLLYYH